MATRKRVKETFSHYDTADYLKSEEDMVAYLEACMEEAGDDPAFIAHALGTIARQRHGTARQRDRAHTRGTVQGAQQRK